jgi:hypothetical protein
VIVCIRLAPARTYTTRDGKVPVREIETYWRARLDGVEEGRDVLEEESCVGVVVVSSRRNTEPDKTNKRRAIREVDVTRCCDLGGCSSGTFDCGRFQASPLPRFRQDALRREPLEIASTPLSLPHTHHKVLTGSPSLFGKRPLSLYSLCYLANLCIDTDDHHSLMATSNTATWRCRQCLASGTTADFTSHGHMKSHLARHGYGTWRCTDCPVIGLRKYALSH